MAGMTVAYLGLGIMGGPMARHLASKGHAVRGFNRSPGKANALTQFGVTACATPAEAAKGARIVFTCVGDSPDVREVLFGKSGAAESAAPGTLFVDHTTIAPGDARGIEADCRAKGLRFLDAPVTGGQKGAEEGALTVMCGGAREDFDFAKPIIESYAKKVGYIGAAGMGQVAKACNQVLVVNNILGAAEALLLADSLGADPTTIWETIKDGAAGSWAFTVYGPKMLKGDDSPGFKVQHQQKDLRIALQAAREAGAPLPGTALIHELYKVVQNRGGDACGNHTLLRALQVMSGASWSAK